MLIVDIFVSRFIYIPQAGTEAEWSSGPETVLESIILKSADELNEIEWTVTHHSLLLVLQSYPSPSPRVPPVPNPLRPKLLKPPSPEVPRPLYKIHENDETI